MEREITVTGKVLHESLQIQISKEWENLFIVARKGDILAQLEILPIPHVVNCNLDKMLQCSQRYRAEA